MNPRMLRLLGDDPDAPFPPTCDALDNPNGLLAAGGGLEPKRLLRAYRLGIFPWYPEHSQHILWWSPAPRCVISPNRVHLSRRTRRRFNSGNYELTLDRSFSEVIHACAAPRAGENGTWITPEMERAYTCLHEMGCAHSLEVWLDGELAGGIYGLAMGAVFFGESMFSNVTDGSKIALVALCRLLDSAGFGLLDCQVGNPHLYSMGAENLGREEFESLLAHLLDKPERWKFGPETRFESRW